MTGFKGTPGPYEMQTPMGEHCPWIVQAGQQAWEWEPIATLGDCTEDGPSPRSKAFQRVRADGQLFAASFDLLTALHGLETSGLLGRLESNASGNPEWETVSQRVNAARAAIARALGEGERS